MEKLKSILLWDLVLVSFWLIIATVLNTEFLVWWFFAGVILTNLFVLTNLWKFITAYDNKTN